MEVALLFNSQPADGESFEADLSSGLERTANLIVAWPPVDLFVSGPELFARDIVSAANYADGAVAPGEVVVLYPSNAGPRELAESHLD